MTPSPFTAQEVAARLGYQHVSTFYRNERKLIAAGMPASTNPCGKRAYDRAGMEAWLTRHDSRRPKTIANDPIAPPMPNSDREWNSFLLEHYGQGSR